MNLENEQFMLGYIKLMKPDKVDRFMDHYVYTFEIKDILGVLGGNTHNFIITPKVPGKFNLTLQPSFKELRLLKSNKWSSRIVLWLINFYLKIISY